MNILGVGWENKMIEIEIFIPFVVVALANAGVAFMCSYIAKYTKTHKLDPLWDVGHTFLPNLEMYQGVADVFVTNVVLKHITIALQLRFYLWTDMAKLLRVLHVQLRAFLIVINFPQQFIGIATEDDSK